MLPQYSKQYRPDDLEFEGDGSTQPFLSSSQKGSNEPESEPPVYPPAQPTLLEERGTVEYRYEPVYPRLGDARSAVGFMGKTMSDTIQIVQKGFPDLAEIEPRRIRFKTDDGAIILDEAWDHLTQASTWSNITQNTMKKMEIMVEDAPGDREQRDRKDNMVLFSILGTVALVIFGFVAFIMVLRNSR